MVPALFALTLLVALTLPPWTSRLSAWLVGGAIVVVAAVVTWVNPTWSMAPKPATGIHVAARGWLIGLTTSVTTIGFLVLGLVAPAVVASHWLPAQPATVAAERVYRVGTSGGQHVVFPVQGGRVDARYAGGVLGADPTAGTRFAYDPAEPEHIMIDSQFRAGRGVLLHVAIAVGLAMVLWCLTVGVSSAARRRAALRALVTDTIVEVGPAVSGKRQVAFAGGRRHTYAATPELDALLRGRGDS